MHFKKWEPQKNPHSYFQYQEMSGFLNIHCFFSLFSFFVDPLYIFFGEHTNLSCTLVNSTTSVTSLENSIFLEKWNHQNISEVRYVNNNGTFTAYGYDVVSENLVSKGIGFLPYSCSSPLCEGKISRRFLNVERKMHVARSLAQLFISCTCRRHLIK